MEDYPHAGFTSFQIKDPMLDGYKPVFKNYGCWKAINVIEDGKNFTVITQNSCSSHFHQRNHDEDDKISAVDSRCLRTVGSFEFIGIPCTVKKIFPHPKLVNLYKRERLYKGEGVSLVNNNLKKINSLSAFHPDITHNTFLKLFSKNYHSYGHFKHRYNNSEELDYLFTTEESKKSKEELTSIRDLGSNKSKAFCFNSSLLDVDSKILDQIIFEDNNLTTYNCLGNRKYTGSCLSCCKIKETNNYSQIIVAYSSGDSGLDLIIKIFNIMDHSNKKGMQIANGSEIKMDFSNEILQTDLVKSKSSTDLLQYTLAVRTNNNITLFEINCTEIKDEHEHFYKFLSTNPVNVLCAVKCKSTITSLSLSPHLKNECIFCLENGAVYLFSNKQTSSFDLTCNDLDVIFNMDISDQIIDIPWFQVLYGSHPRTVYVANLEKVAVVNIRSGKHKILFDVKNAANKFDCIWSISKSENIHEVFVSTNFNLYLFDERHIGEPALKWSLSTQFPCLFVNSLKVDLSEYDSPKRKYQTNAVMATSQISQETYCFQYCNSLFDQKCPPQNVGTPTIIESFNDTYYKMNSDNINFLQDNYLQDRLNCPLRGIAPIRLVNFGSTIHIVIFQLNSLGDMGYQTLVFDEIVETIFEVTTFNADNLKISDETKENYTNWSLKAVEGMSPIKKDKETLGVDCKLTPRFFDTILDRVKTKQHPHCTWCNKLDNIGEHLNLSLEQKNETCERCGFDIYSSTKLTNVIKNDQNGSKPGKAWLNPKLDHDSIPDLKLIDINPDTGSECAKVLKGTWDDSYENYWKKMLEKAEKQQQQAQQDSLDIMQSQ